MFVDMKSESVIESMNRRNYILLKEKIQDFGNTISLLSSNYDFRGPISYHDQAVITQLSNELRTLELLSMLLSIICKKTQWLASPSLFNLEERTPTPPRDEVSSTHVH